MHRNLKVDNLMVDTDGYLKIVDFGLARSLMNNEANNTLIGAPAYFAPEQLKGEPYDKTVDFWAVGIIMYQMLTGALPFHSKNLYR